jgi:predicted transposase/invertase (TIGR01784 family)
MPKFNKTVDQLETRFDKWLYVLKNLNRLHKVPDKLHEKIFEKLFETAEIAKFTPEQVQSYEDSLKYYRDIKNSLDTAKEEGKIEGKIEGKFEEKQLIAKNLLNENVDINLISAVTGLTVEQISKLKD